MKYAIILFLFLGAALVNAQTPLAMKYQAVARNSSGSILSDQKVAFEIGIIKDDLQGDPDYVETHDVTTNKYGLVNLIIGQGNAIKGNLADIDWGEGAYYIQTGIDVQGGSNFILLGTSQLLSVPFALYSEAGGTSSQYWTTGNLNTTNVDAVDEWIKLDDFIRFDKQHAKTKIEITTNGILSGGSFTAGTFAVKFAMRVDDEPAQIANEGVVKQSNSESFQSMYSVFENLSPGEHMASIWVRAVNGASTGILADPGGWGSRMIVKETW